MNETPLITRVSGAERFVHQAVGTIPSIRVRIVCDTVSGPLVLLIAANAANELEAHLRHLAPKSDSR